MQLASLRLAQDTDQQESLALALHALLTNRRAADTVEAINVALGLGLTARLSRTESVTEACVETDRDAHLSAAAHLFGIRLRDLHPRPAAVGLGKAPEFQGHFVDSYAPLILRALAAGEPVLAWGGWPAPASMRWGLLTQTSDEGMGFAGIVYGHGAAVTLASAALQCYVVETVAPQHPDGAAILRCGVRALLEEGKQASASGSAAVGVAAYDWWRAHLGAKAGACPPHHGAVARRLVANYRGAHRFLTMTAAQLEPAWRAATESLATQLAGAADTLVPLAEGTSRDVDRVAAMLVAARAHESRIHADLARLHEAMGL